MSKEDGAQTGATDDQTLQGEGQEGANDSAAKDDGKAVDWEAKYKEAIQQSRKWEKLANADHKKAEAAKAANDDAESRAASLQKELDDLKAERVRELLVAEVAKDKAVDAGILARMAGDTREAIEENADMLAGIAPADTGNSYPKVKDKGESKTPPTTKEEILAIKNPRERREAIAANLKLFE